MTGDKHLLTGDDTLGYTCLHCGLTWAQLNPVEILLTDCHPITRKETGFSFGKVTWEISDTMPTGWTEEPSEATFFFQVDPATPPLTFLSFSWGRDEAKKTPEDKGNDLLRQWTEGDTP